MQMEKCRKKQQQEKKIDSKTEQQNFWAVLFSLFCFINSITFAKKHGMKSTKFRFPPKNKNAFPFGVFPTSFQRQLCRKG